MMTRTARTTRRAPSPIRATDLFPTSEQVTGCEMRAAQVRAWFARLDAAIARCESGDPTLSLDDARAEMASIMVEGKRLGI